MKLKIILAFSILILIMGAVSANENLTDMVSQSPDIEVVENAADDHTFAYIQKQIDEKQPEDTIELNGTYTGSGSAIKITKNLKFDGGSSGATLDACKLSGIFTTSLEKFEITFNNLNFINAKNGVFTEKDSYNSYSKLHINNCNFTDNTGGEYGAVNCYECIVKDSNFINNRASGIYDGTDYVSWGGAIEARKCTLLNCNFERNTAISSGGAVDAGNVEVFNCSFKENSAKYYGGAINGDFSVKDSNFTSNYVTVNNGGAICGDGSVSNSVFTSNRAGFCGGAISGSVRVENSRFTANRAEYAGAIHSPYGFVEIISSTFTSNDDGAVIANGITVKTPDKTFSGKTVMNNDLNSFKLVKVDVKKLTTTYDSGKTLQITLTKTNSLKAAPNLGVKVTAYKGKKKVGVWMYTDEYMSSNAKGIATFQASKLPVGTYTLKFSEGYENNEDGYFTCPIGEASVSVKITKAKTKVKAPKVTAKYKKTKYFKVTVKNKATKKVVKSLKLKVKVYTGKKYKSYTIKTNKKGVAKLNTKKLKRGNHKVVVTSKNNNYKLSKKSSIKIK